MSTSSLWAIAVITITIFAGIIVALLVGAKELVPTLATIGTTLAAAVAAAGRNKNDKDASR